METTLFPSIELPDLKGKMAKALSTTTRVFDIQRTPIPVVDIPLHKDEYTDEQFHADVKKASKRLDTMVWEALEEDAQGGTRKFPA